MLGVAIVTNDPASGQRFDRDLKPAPVGLLHRSWDGTGLVGLPLLLVDERIGVVVMVASSANFKNRPTDGTLGRPGKRRLVELRLWCQV
jgi:hypothetical protein